MGWSVGYIYTFPWVWSHDSSIECILVLSSHLDPSVGLCQRLFAHAGSRWQKKPPASCRTPTPPDQMPPASLPTGILAAGFTTTMTVPNVGTNAEMLI